LIERLVLGTVQLGLEYGINNKHGKPPREYALQILDKAYELGIRIIDTAAAYGDAEDVIGEWFRVNRLQNEVKIISKLKPNIFDAGGSVSQIIKDQLCGSLERLNVDSLYGYLLHTAEYVYDNEVLESLSECKKNSLTLHCGVSIYDEKEALYAAENKLVDFIQIPYSFLDQRLDKTDFFNISNLNKKTIFARSPFVQGLVFMKNERIPELLGKAKDYLEILDRIVSKYNIPIYKASMLFSLFNKRNDYIVFGVDTIEQLTEDCDFSQSENVIGGFTEEFIREFGVTDKIVVMPSLWKK